MNRIEKKFKELKKSRKKAFIAFINAGYPNIKVTEKLVREFERIGVDIVELGVPFSDPMADGPVIQESSQVALRHKVNLNIILKLVKRLRQKIDLPICLMTYYNPIFCFGEEKFLKRAHSCGVDGVIVPDLPPEEARSLIKLAAKFKVDIICFISPTTSLKRMRHIAQVARGFIYYLSLTGTTGARKKLPGELLDSLKLVKRNTDKPVCVGFGISSREQVRQISKIADGVIVGSAIVKKIKENIGKPDLIKRVSSFVKTLKL
ncbi:MAG: tryptophan synthase subunit alpha [Candidatus Omnitrophica bacterium]|nr:tryptophan synthase subunit alpha [Candidatus Omnitrophota bacterium]